ncbi:cyclin-dependent kinase G-1-like isoform X1 [Zingiber officinale]|uniref:cyclin-dependent kinase G-1-like isoform X1 n=1 Tax=Zingiber officinale TaxID=94328 RepID=UPI001C4B1E6D|nr:cyclin-dependent kinase G-1-like isoform X1 [Zingiber officinale]
MTALRVEVEDVIEFLRTRGFSAAAAALRDDLLSRRSAGEAADLDLDLNVGFDLPPLKLSPLTRGGAGVAESSPPSASSSSSDAFVSIGSSPSELLNPYGVWSPARSRSDEESTDGHSNFGTAREYNNYWYDDQLGGYYDNPFFVQNDSERLHMEDKFIMSREEKNLFENETHDTFDVLANDHRHEHDDVDCQGCANIYNCPFPICNCCNGSKNCESGEVAEMVRSTSFAIYGRYQVLDDQTERLDECGENQFNFIRKHDHPDTIVLEHDLFHDKSQVEGKECSGSDLAAEKLQTLNANAVADSGFTKSDTKIYKDIVGDSYARDLIFLGKRDDGELQRESFSLPTLEEVSKQDANSAYGHGDDKTVDKKLEESEAVDGELEGDIGDKLHFHASSDDELEVFNLRIIHRKNRTGFEENKEFPVILKSVIAGRYYITKYLGSAAFSKVVQAHDLHTGMDVSLKIIKNDKDFFDQSLDEIKLLKFVNKHDPSDEHHVLCLYDYFYYQEHLFIVTELLRANLYEFQKYNHESGGEEYYTLPRIRAIARQCLEALEFLHHLRIIHCDLKPENILIKSYRRCEIKVIDLGSSCFETDNLSVYVQSRSYRAPEVILGLPFDQKIDIWSLGCILAELHTGNVLFPNDSVPLILARIMGILGPIDEEMLVLGQETSKYFTESFDLYHLNEEMHQMEYLIPERSSLSQQLQDSDTEFVDFLSYLLQINPSRRPTASEALQHRWLSFSYH